MKLVVDANLSPRVARHLRRYDHEAVHVGDVGLLRARDPEILLWAREHDYTIISGDTDFGALLAQDNQAKPSFVLLRHLNDLTPDEQAALLVANLPAVEDHLALGAVVTIVPGRIRVRTLPIRSNS